MQNVKKKPIRKIGIVSIKQCKTPTKGRSYWELRYKDPTTGLDVKRRLSGTTWEEVRIVAEHLTREAYLGKGYLADKRKPLGIEDGIIEALCLTRTREYVRRERAGHGARFMKWLARTYPGVTTWDQMRPAMLNAYKAELEQRGLAYDSIRLSLAPVRLAWKHMTVQVYFPQIVVVFLPQIDASLGDKYLLVCYYSTAMSY